MIIDAENEDSNENNMSIKEAPNYCENEKIEDTIKDCASIEFNNQVLVLENEIVELKLKLNKYKAQEIEANKLLRTYESQIEQLKLDVKKLSSEINILKRFENDINQLCKYENENLLLRKQIISAKLTFNENVELKKQINSMKIKYENESLELKREIEELMKKQPVTHTAAINNDASLLSEIEKLKKENEVILEDANKMKMFNLNLTSQVSLIIILHRMYL